MKTKFLLPTIILVAVLMTIQSCTLPRIGMVKSKEVTDVNATGGKATADIIDLGDPQVAEAHGWCWGTQPEPTIDINSNNYGKTDQTGEFSGIITGLQPNKRYYVRPYITIDDEILYGEQMQIQTSQLEFNVTNPALNNIWGLDFRYDITWTANIFDSLKIELYKGTELAETITNETPNNGTYQWTVTSSLQEATNYSIKITSLKNDDINAKSDNFTIASDAPPQVTTQAVTDVSYFTATANGTIVNFGTESSATQHGHCWSTSQNPTIANSKTELGTTSTIGSFSSSITGLSDNTTYYVRAYAINRQGTSYGSQVSFKTPLEIEIEMIYVTGGSFEMGCGTGQSDCEGDENPVHTVTLSNFYIGKYEVTQAQYLAVMGTNPVSGYGVGDNYPVYYVSWYHTLVFCNKLSMMEGLTPVYTISGSTNPDNWGAVPTSDNATWNAATCNWSANGYRLPTEAEWEYAARGGTNYTDYYMYAGSNTIGDVAWYTNNSSNTTHIVGTKAANQRGIYDMSGNVWEWCGDWKGTYSSSSQTNPTGASSGSYRVIRGGSWLIGASYCRVANRGGSTPSSSLSEVGFRVSRKD